MIDFEYNQYIAGNLFNAAFLILISIYIMWKLRKTNPIAVYGMWYAFFMVLSISSVIAFWAVTNGAISERGEIIGTKGKSVIFLMNAMLELEKEFIFVLVISGLSIIPQAFAYAFSSVFGCAAQMKLFAFTAKGAFWFVVKSFLSASAVMSVLIATFLINKWPGIMMEDICNLVFLATLAFAVSFALLIPYYDFDTLNKYFPKCILGAASYLHGKATRNVDKTIDTTFPVNSASLPVSYQRWEYIEVPVNQSDSSDSVLNEMNADGWELVSVVSLHPNHVVTTLIYYFKRPVIAHLDHRMEAQEVTLANQLSRLLDGR